MIPAPAHIFRHFRHILRSLPLLFICLIIQGCVKNEFKVEFHLPVDINDTYRLSYYASNSSGGLLIESAVAVQAGKGVLPGITRYPTLVSIYSASGHIPAAILYATRGDKIEITGDSPDPVKWTISGNKVNSRLQEWRSDNADLITEAAHASLSDYGYPPSLASRMNKAVTKFVETYPDSPASFFILYTYFDISADRKGFARLDKILSEHGLDQEYGALMARHDLISSGASAPVNVADRDLIIRTSDSIGRDTLRLKSGKVPLLIAMRHDEEETSYTSLTDSIKHLAKWRKDTTSMRIADLVVTMDSAHWAYRVRRDSLRGIARGFIPAGLADRDLMRLGVRRLPWYIVSSSGGKILYSGPDWTDASSKFKSLRPK